MKFHKRFDMKVDIDQAKKLFVTRIYNQIYVPFKERIGDINYNILSISASALGTKYKPHQRQIDKYFSDDFYDNLKIIESVYADKRVDILIKKELDEIIWKLIKESEVYLEFRA